MIATLAPKLIKKCVIIISALVLTSSRLLMCNMMMITRYTGQEQSDEVELLSRIVPSKFEGRRVILIDELLDKVDQRAQHLSCELHLCRERIIISFICFVLVYISYETG